MSNQNELKVSLTLLKKLVKALEDSLENSYLFRDDLDRDQLEAYNDFAVEISKAQGLAAGVSTESIALISDIKKLVQLSFPGAAAPKDELSELMKTFASQNKPGVN